MDNSTEERLLLLEEFDREDLKKRVWNESKKLWRIAFPGIIARVTSFGMIVVTQLFMGHISELDLAAFGLQQSILLRFVNGILIGMSSATETLCGQAYGAEQYHMMGIYLQRSWIIDGVTATILLPLFIFTTPILILIGQEENIAIEAGKISLWFIPILYYFVFSLTIQMYLQAQQKNKIVGWFSASSFLLHVLLSWLFVIKLGFGLAGAMSSFIISSWLLVIGEFVYIFGGWCPNTWKGFTKAAFADMLPLIKLSISSGVMICLELWYSSILVVLAGYMKNATIAISAFSICLNINGWEFMVCLGFLGSSCVRISNELGRGNAKAAKFSIKVALVTSIIIGIIFWVLCMVFSREISYLFTSSEEIAESVSRLHVLLAFSMLLNSIYPVLTGVAVGAGVQRKRSSEKTIAATNKFGISVKGIDEETQNIPTGNGVGPVRAVRNLNEKLASVLLDCHVVTENEKSVPRATAGQEKEEAEVDCLKKELDGDPKKGLAANQKLSHPDAALKKCMQQLNSFREEQEQKIHDAVMEATSEFEKAQKTLEVKLMETSKRLTNLAIENTNLSNALLLKEKLVEELHKRASQTVAEFNTLMARLDNTEKENAFLKYEFHMLQKELEVRNEELEYNHRSADASRRQHLESMRKVTKLEAECQRLRTLMRKRLPGPAAFSKMKSEAEMLGRDQMELRKPNLTRDLVVRDPIMGNFPETPVKNVDFLIDQLLGKEEENKALREMMSRKNAKLQSSRIMFSRTASRLSQVEAQLVELSGDQRSLELAKHSPSSREIHSPTAGSDTGSLANALIAELEHFRDRKLKSPSECKDIEVLDMSLMDDFVEMEKLAIVSTQTPSAGGNSSFSAGKELVPIELDHSGYRDKKQEIHSKQDSTDKSFDWLQVVLNAIFKQQRISKRSLTELLEDIKIALGYINHPNASEPDAAALSRHPLECDIGGYITWKSPNESSIANSLNETSSIDTPMKETSKQHDQSNLSNLQEENGRLKNELDNMEARLQSATDKTETLMVKLRESEQSVERLQAEVEILKESKGMVEDQIENQKSINEDLDTQLTVTKAKLNEVFQKFSSLEVELEDRSNCCEELEATCLELQLQLESAAKETLSCGINKEGKHPQDGWEIKAASVKLAECQETILNLGKQLKALASPREAALFDKVFTTTGATTTATNIRNFNKRFSLRDQMLAEDRSKEIILRSPTEDAQKSSLDHSDNGNGLISPNALVCAPEAYIGPEHKAGDAAVDALAIVPSKKQGFGLLRRLLMRRKKGTSKKSRSLVKV